MILNITGTPCRSQIPFGCKQPKTMTNIVDNIFLGLSKTRNKSNLGLLLGKNGDTNYVVEEKVFGKNAKISFVDDEGFQQIEVLRVASQPVQINPLSENISCADAEQLIRKNLTNIDYEA